MILCLASLLSPPEEHSTVVKANVSLNLEMPNVLQRFLFCIVNVWLYVCILIESEKKREKIRRKETIQQYNYRLQKRLGARECRIDISVPHKWQRSILYCCFIS